MCEDVQVEGATAKCRVQGMGMEGLCCCVVKKRPEGEYRRDQAKVEAGEKRNFACRDAIPTRKVTALIRAGINA